MSMILKGIDLPQTLYTDIRIYWDGRIKKIIGENTMISYKNAQAIQIPKEHGDIKDIDELRKGLEADTREAFTRHDVWLILSKYNTNVPTILEAET